MGVSIKPVSISYKASKLLPYHSGNSNFFLISLCKSKGYLHFEKLIITVFIYSPDKPIVMCMSIITLFLKMSIRIINHNIVRAFQHKYYRGAFL